MLSYMLFKKYLFSKNANATVKTIAWLSLVGITIGISAFIIVISIMNGFNGIIKNRFLAVEPHLVINTDQAKNAQEELKALTIVNGLSGVESVQMVSEQDVFLRTLDGLFNGAIYKGIKREDLKSLFVRVRDLKKKSMQGRTEMLLSTIDTMKPGDVLVGYDLATSMGVYEGDSLVLIPSEMLVASAFEVPKYSKSNIVGIFQTDILDIDSRYVYFIFGTEDPVLKNAPSRRNLIELKLSDPDQSGKLKNQFTNQHIQAETWIERNSALFLALSLEKGAMTSFLGLSALIAAFSIITVLVLLIKQKKKEIGIMMTMGLSQSRARRVFIGVGMLLSFSGVFVGMCLGSGIVAALNRWPIDLLPSDVYYDTTIPVELSPNFLVMTAILSAVVALVAATVPVKRFVNDTPVEALRGSFS